LSPEGVGTLWNAGPFGDQIAWLKADLEMANKNRHNQPWIIVIGHRPLYSTAQTDFPPDSKGNARRVFEDIFYENNIDMFICGHVHSYERFYPVYKDKLEQSSYDNPRAPTYIVAGNSGNIEGHTTLINNPPDYLAISNQEDYGYGILEIHNSTSLSWTMYDASNMTALDSFNLYREH